MCFFEELLYDYDFHNFSTYLKACVSDMLYHMWTLL